MAGSSDEVLSVVGPKVVCTLVDGMHVRGYVGYFEGNSVGFVVGYFDGIPEEFDDGCMAVGSNVGSDVGNKDGTDVGDNVCNGVGIDVGNCDGT